MGQRSGPTPEERAKQAVAIGGAAVNLIRTLSAPTPAETPAERDVRLKELQRVQDALARPSGTQKQLSNSADALRARMKALEAAPRPEVKEPEKPDFVPNPEMQALARERGLLPGQTPSGIPRSGRSAAPRGVAKAPLKPKNSGANREAPSRRRAPDEGASEESIPTQSTGPEETEDADETESADTITPEEPIIAEDADENELDGLGAQLCREGSEAESRGQLLAALGHYRNCLFDKETRQERPDVDRTTLYRLIVRTAEWMDPPLEPPKRARVSLDAAGQAKEPLKYWHEALFFAPWWMEPHYQIAIQQSRAPDSEDVQVHLAAFLAAAPTEDPRVKDAEKQLERSKEYVHKKQQ